MTEEISKNDLFILMESYKNNIQLNTTLLEQQKQIMVINSQAIEKHQDLCKSVDELIDKLTTCSRILSDNHTKISNDLNMLSTRLGAEFTTLNTNLTIKMGNEADKLNSNDTKICNKLDTEKTNLSNEHEKITNKVYLAFIAMGGLVISIIGLAISFADKFHSLSTLLKSHIGG
jgi:Fe2+ transport system protein B